MTKKNDRILKKCDYCNGVGTQPDWSNEFFTEEEKPCWFCNGQGQRYIKIKNSKASTR